MPAKLSCQEVMPSVTESPSNRILGRSTTGATTRTLASRKPRLLVKKGYHTAPHSAWVLQLDLKPWSRMGSCTWQGFSPVGGIPTDCRILLVRNQSKARNPAAQKTSDNSSNSSFAAQLVVLDCVSSPTLTGPGVAPSPIPRPCPPELVNRDYMPN